MSSNLTSEAMRVPGFFIEREGWIKVILSAFGNAGYFESQKDAEKALSLHMISLIDGKPSNVVAEFDLNLYREKSHITVQLD